MNYLFVFQKEYLPQSSDNTMSTGQVSIIGDRARKILHEHGLKSGLKLACVVENLGRGKIEIISCSAEKIEAFVKIEELPPPRLELHLAVAYSRPQTIKKILQISASFGVLSLSFVKTNNVVASYLQSKSLHALEVQRQLLMGCEQAGDTVFPQINHFKSFREFVGSSFIFDSTCKKYFGDITAERIFGRNKSPSLLLLGPESGLTEEEKSELLEIGFGALSLGPRVLRQEVAAAALLGAFQALIS